jgi:putative hydrolase of the HAD superfamily
LTTILKAVSFDLWDTIIDDESDEPKRLAQGLRPKPAERRYLLWQALSRHQDLSLEDVRWAYNSADARFRKAWSEDAVTWPVAERLRVALDALDTSLPDDELEDLAECMGRMEVDIPPDPVAGMAGVVEELSLRYKLSVTSDTIVTPGTRLREILAGYGLMKYFSAFAFSDEVGRSKPHPSMFEAGARVLGVEPAEMVHVGDRDANDVKGAQALGMKAVLFTAARDVDKAATSADAICERAADLPAIIDGLAK